MTHLCADVWTIPVVSPFSLGPLLRPESLLQLLVQAAGGVLLPGRIGETCRGLDYVWLLAVAAQAPLRIVCGDDVHFLPAVEAMDLVIGGCRVTARVAVEDAVASRTDGAQGLGT